MNTTALIIVCAASIVVNIFLISFCTRLMHWVNYWRGQYNEAVKEITPIVADPYKAIQEMYNWKEGWD